MIHIFNIPIFMMNGSTTIHLYFIKYIKQLFNNMGLSIADNEINMNYLAITMDFIFIFIIIRCLDTGSSRCRNLFEHKGEAVYFL